MKESKPSIITDTQINCQEKQSYSKNKQERILGFDIARSICMIYIIGVFHLTQYLGEQYYLWYNDIDNNFMCACLGTFSLISGLLLGKKYEIHTLKDSLLFYKKRIVRFYPLFILTTFLLLLIGMNTVKQSIIGLLSLHVNPEDFRITLIP